MYEWSKAVTKKIADKHLMKPNELSIVEIALRLEDLRLQILKIKPEQIGKVSTDKSLYNADKNTEEIISKIKESRCLSDIEFSYLELAMIMNSAVDDILDEAIKLSEDNKFELNYTV